MSSTQFLLQQNQELREQRAALTRVYEAARQVVQDSYHNQSAGFVEVALADFELLKAAVGEVAAPEYRPTSAKHCKCAVPNDETLQP